jgi:hypothetical protein
VRRFAPQLFAQLCCISLLCFFVCNTHGQIRRRLTAQQPVQNREWALESLRRQARIRPAAREQLLDQVSLKNDFRQIQITNNSLMAGVFERPATQRISNKEIRSSLGEIKKLAERLRSNLGLPRTEPSAETDVAVTEGLRQLDQALMSFVDNPLFQQPRVYDAEMALRAAGNLTEVVRLADLLRKLTRHD